MLPAGLQEGLQHTHTHSHVIYVHPELLFWWGDLELPREGKTLPGGPQLIF